MMAGRGPDISLADVATGARFLWSLPAFLRHPISVEQARAILRRRLEERESDFLALVRWGVYQPADGPYRTLLRLAGCEYGDLARLVGQEGVEGALHILFGQGVYLTADEFKGRRPVIRGSARVAVVPGDLANPGSIAHVPARSSGSRDVETPVAINLPFVRDCAVGKGLILDAYRGIDWVHALWGVPGGAAVSQLLQHHLVGARPARWFSQVDASAPGLHPRYRWSARAMRWGSLAAGAALPRPEYVPLDDPLPIARWMAGVLRAGRVPHLWTFPSPAVRLCRAARDAGLDLGGARFTLGGEPTTAARLAMIRAVGAEAAPSYGSAECGPIAYACAAATVPDDLHLLSDLHAMIQPGVDGAPATLPAQSLLITSIRATCRFILLNVSLGDQATLARQACGCPLERLGWATHLQTIRSFEKLTAGGMAVPDAELGRVLDEVLPTRFGGGATDYQLVEEEAEDGQPYLRLVVHPAVGPLDEGMIVETVLAALEHGSGAERVMALQWRQSGLLRVERRAPEATSSGKILHVHSQRRSRQEAPI